MVNLKYVLLRATFSIDMPIDLFTNLVNLVELDLSYGSLDYSQNLFIDHLGCVEGRLKALGIDVYTMSDPRKLVRLSSFCPLEPSVFITLKV